MINEGRKLISRREFDSSYYLNKYPDVGQTNLTPYEHYIKYGVMLGRDAKKLNNQTEPSPVKKLEYLDFVADSLAKYKEKFSFDYTSREDLPLVSVIMTSFNAEDTIEKSVFSVLNQSYPNVEVIVCDDHSSDSTWHKLRALEKRCRSLKVMRQNSNYGTYLAKNVAIKESKGEIIFFQDSDDISHPERISVQVKPLIVNSQLVCTRTKYLRYDDSDGRIIKVGGNTAKFGLITLAVRREIFEELGFFDCVRKAGDDEFVQRIRRFYGKKSMLDQDVTLYCALLRANSLVADMIKHNSDGSVEQSSSNERKQYVKIFNSRFASKHQSYFKKNFKPFPLRSTNTYPASIASLGRDNTKVVVSLCSIPSREKSLEKTINSLKDQVDIIYVYLDGYTQPPSFLDSNPKVTITSVPMGDSPRDNAKFIPYNKLKESLGMFYYFTCDDDIIYPPDYVNTMVRAINKFDKKAVLGVHGVVVAEKAKSYFKNRFIYHFENDDLSQYSLVNNIGTGTGAFHSSVISNIDVKKWPQGGMVDIFFGDLCYENNVPLIVVPRHSGWLYTDPDASESPTLFSEYKAKNKEKLILDVLSKSSSEGYSSISKVVKNAGSEKICRLLPDFNTYLKVADFFLRYR